VPIPDNVPAGVNIMLPVAGVGTVADLNFRFDEGGACNATVGNTNAAMDHTFIGDLTFRLTPPDGAPTVAFQARRGGTRENICLTNLNDEGGFPNVSTLTSVTGMPQMGNFTPETTGMLSLLDGENANGTWVLNVSDNAGIDTGAMRRFSLIFNSGNAPEELIPAPGDVRQTDMPDPPTNWDKNTGQPIPSLREQRRILGDQPPGGGNRSEPGLLSRLSRYVMGATETAQPVAAGWSSGKLSAMPAEVLSAHIFGPNARKRAHAPDRGPGRVAGSKASP
jgi:subtilisin-like proprotein convertase family protein